VQTQQVVINLLSQILNQWMFSQEPDIQMAGVPADLRKIFEATNQNQKEIGYQQLLFGRISRLWVHLQDGASSLSDENHPHLLAQQWAVIFIHTLWDLAFAMWQIRNNILHHPDKEEKSQMRKWLCERVRDEYDWQQSLPYSHPLFSEPLAEKQESSNDELIKWLQSVELHRLPPGQNRPRISRYKYIHASRAERSIVDSNYTQRNTPTDKRIDDGTAQLSLAEISPFRVRTMDREVFTYASPENTLERFLGEGIHNSAPSDDTMGQHV